MGYIGQTPTAVPLNALDIADGSITASDLNATLDLSSKTVTLPSSSVTPHVTNFNDQDIRSDILKLALHQAIDGNRVAYNLEDSFVDGFEDSSGLTTLTDVMRNTSNEYCSPRVLGASDYTSDSYSSGDRTSLITVTRSSSPELFHSSYLPSTNNMFVDGVTSSGVAYIDTSAVGGWLKFDFGAGVTKLVTGLQWYLSQSYSPDFRLDGSNDDLSWTTIGASIDIGTGVQLPAEKWTGLTHTTEYRYYRLYETAGGSNSGGDLREINFKIPTTSVNATGTLISDPQTASSSRTSASGVIIYEDAVGTSTLGTDLKIYFSCDNSTWTEASSYGTPQIYSGTKKLVKLGATTCTAGTSVAMKAEWAGQSASTGTEKVITAVGDTQHSTAQNKIGSSSIYFDGSGSFRDGVNTNADRITVPDSNDWHFPANQCTIDFWIRAASVNGYNGAKSMGLMSHNPSGADPVQNWEFYINGNGKGAFLPIGSGLTGTTTLTDNTWHHLAIVYDGSVIKLYVDGTSEASRSATSGLFGNVATTLNIGSMYSASGDFTGYMDEIRISNTARYTANFTPSTTAFTSDANTLLLLHSDTTNSSTTFADSSVVTGKEARLHGWGVSY